VPDDANALRLGVDLGGSKIEAALLNGAGEVCVRRRVATPGDYDAILTAIAQLCAAVEEEGGLDAGTLPMGIGTPGSASPATGLMRNCNSTVLNGRALAEDLSLATGRRVRMANDADCFALSEARDGAGADEHIVFGVILGTGVGGGIVVGGGLLAGPNRITGEWGHNRLALERCPALPPALRAGPRRCYCGADDCVETWLSGAGLARTHEELHGEALDVAALHGRRIEGRLADTLDLYIELVGMALAAVVNVLDPAVVVLGGGLSNIDVLYDGLPGALGHHLFSDCSFTRLCRAHHGDSGGVRGAAWLW
jgi:predicted NBD/HSP70 family sugar kinase